MKRCFFRWLFCGTLFCWMSINISLAATSTSTCSPLELVALRSFAASLFPAGNFSRWDQASDDCCAWGAPSIICSAAASNFPGHHTNNNTSSREWRRVTGLILDTSLLNYPIPFSLCDLSSLTSLHLTGNPSAMPGGLLGSIPHCIGTHLTSLVDLDLSFNSLAGPIPQSFSLLKSLQSLNLAHNSLTGTIPHSFSHLQSLHSLDLSSNRLSGQPFPSSRVVLPNLTQLDLSYNAFSGPIPSFNTPLLQQLHLSYNSFSGSVDSVFTPRSLLSSLWLLDLFSNSLSGEIPTFDPSHFPSLAYLNLQDNLFHGNLPDSICGLKNLTSLSLSSNAFSGSLLLSTHSCRRPKFSQLWLLDVSYNQFVGAFPEWVGSLSNLQRLDLSYNTFTGSLPNSWQNLSLVWNLQLSGNSLVAPNPSAPKLPSWFFTLPSLQGVALSSLGIQATDLHCPSLLLFLNRSTYQDLDLSLNNVNSGILLCLSNHSTYRQVLVGSLNLSGNPLALNLNLEKAIQILPQPISVLDMSSCELSGRLSGAFFDRIGSSSVLALYVAHNYLEGQVPAQLGNLSWLTRLDLAHNYFTGVAPLEAPKLPWIADIGLSNNHLSGKLSALLENILNISATHQNEGNTQLMENLDVSNNFLTGLIPPSLAQCIASRLKLNNNYLEGLIPNEPFENNRTLLDLHILSLSNNQLTGQIPSSFKNLRGLVLLDLSHNSLNGSLETIILFSNSSSNQYAQLRVLLMSYNDFTGSVPPNLEVVAPALQLIDFSNNHLTGMIPVHSLQGLSAFRAINTSSNPRLGVARGTLYEELRIRVKGNEQSYEYVLAALTLLDLSGNNLRGPISTGLGELSGLVSLNLSRNRFSGPIPSDLGKLVFQLQSLDLSLNELVGAIPPSFQNLTNLEVFNVSYNPGLYGPILQNQPQFEIAESYIGDPNLCGAPILHSCTNATHEKPSPHSETSIQARKSSKFAEWIGEWISIPGLCLGIVVGVLGTLCILAMICPR